MRLSSRWLPYAVTLSPALLLLLALPLASRLALGWSDPRGYLSDLAIGGGLLPRCAAAPSGWPYLY